MTVAKIRTLRWLLTVLAVLGLVVLGWLGPWREWGHALHQELRVSGARVNGAVTHAARANRALAGDDAISAAVNDAFAASQSDDLRALRVDTSNAMVTLSGTLPSAALRGRAIALAQQVNGVHGVFCLVEVVQPAAG